ncbi:LysR substrate-binding domain-containing protein [Stutzerimonas marianensis]
MPAVPGMTVRMPPLYALRAFEVAARFGSFTQAAESLCITQSAVSRHVKTLEESLGCQLFERRGSRLALTDTGRVLAQELKAGFRTLENACIAVTRQRDALRLKAPSTLTMRWLLGVLDDFHLHHPQDRVQLTSAWMDLDAVDFHNEPFDCAILLGHGGFPADWNRVKLFDEWLVPVCSPGFQGGAPWTLERLASAELIHPSRDCRDWRRWLQRVGWVDAVAWQQGKLFDTLELGISAAAQGHGISIGDLALVEAELQKGSLMLPFDQAVRSGDSYYLVWPAGGETPVTLTRMKEHLLRHLPDRDNRGIRLLE